MITIVALVVVVLATARLTRLITYDKIAEPFRMWVYRKFGTDSRIAELIECHWCVATWNAMATSTYVLALADHTGALTTLTAIAVWPLLVSAVAYAASWILDKEER